MTRPTALIVLGMHRSGTSATAGVLANLGVAFGDRLMPATSDNPGGYFEHLDLVALHDELLDVLGRSWYDPRPMPPGWAADPRTAAIANRIGAIIKRDFSSQPLWGVKDPRLCRLLPLWLPLLDKLGVRVGCVHVLRHPAEVGASIHSRDGFNFDHAGMMWLRHTIETEVATRQYPRIRIAYSNLVSDWAGAMTEIARRLEFSWPVPLEQAATAVNAFVSSGHRHHRAAGWDGFSPTMAGWLQSVHNSLTTAPDENAIATALDTIASEASRFDEQALAVYETVIDQYVSHLKSSVEQLQRMRSSLSWQMMRPLRAVGRALTGRRI